LEAVLVYVLFRSGRREFPLFFSYIFCRVVASITTASYFYLFRGAHFYGIIYWMLDLSLHGLVIAVLVSLMRRTLGKPSAIHVIGGTAIVVFGVAIALIAPFDGRIGFWMTGAIRNLSFFEELMNLALWMLLVRRGRTTPRVLWVSAGLGIQVTGDVLGHSIRLFASKSAIWAPNALMNVCEITALAMWLYAFCRSESQQRLGALRARPSSPQVAGSPYTPGPSAEFFPD
jgi:hypothetical protein